ncbi:MAG: toll/interleukin-1 receptor domain-containing protein [Ruminococcaceae bacterium]|nr:toll/interleukin-1 receptor domain-containing protein [Oscillospiraceae bacterium]
MPNFYTAEAVKEKPFLFISYSHEDKTLTAEMARFLLDSGVRLWYDTGLAAGDPWADVVKDLIEDANCRGIIFVCSPASYVSQNVHEERALALKVQQERGADKYPFFIVNVCESSASGSYMSLLQKTFEMDFGGQINKLFPIKHLYTLMKIIGPDPLCIMTAGERWHTELFEEGIRRKALETVDRGAAAEEKIQKNSAFSGAILTFGSYNGTPLKWQLVYREGENGVFLLQSLLPAAYGEGLEQWLKQEFRSTAFAPEEAKLIRQLRLLLQKETQKLTADQLKADAAWWLGDCTGSRQAEVKAEGVVSALRQVNHRFQRGVRPVMILNLEVAEQLMNKS